jgi:hypothetical protein
VPFGATTRQFFSDQVDQLDLALDQLAMRDRNFDRFALMLIDNVVELTLHNHAEDKQSAIAYSRRRPTDRFIRQDELDLRDARDEIGGSRKPPTHSSSTIRRQRGRGREFVEPSTRSRSSGCARCRSAARLSDCMTRPARPGSHPFH